MTFITLRLLNVNVFFPSLSIFCHTRHLLLLQGLIEDQQQGPSSCRTGREAEVHAATDREPAPEKGSTVCML